MQESKPRVTRDIIDLRNRFRRTITDLETFSGDIMSASREMIQFIKVDPNSKKYGVYLSKILKNIQSMNEVIVKIYANRHAINPEPIYVDNALQHILNERREKPEFATLKLVEEYNAPDIRTVMDRVEFEEMMTHLIKNAQEAVNGDGRITLRTHYQAEKKLVRIEVADNGCGITSGIRPHIFSRHFTTKEGREGLGLAIVNDTVQAYGGTVDAESGGEKRGAVFTVVLPENLDLYDEVRYYTNKFYYSGKVDAFVQKFLLGFSDDKVAQFVNELCQLEPGYKCLSREQINTLLSKKKEYFLGRSKGGPAAEEAQQ
jgi:signal transduction histidine kinase